jgi:hypothetical protein
VVLLACALPVTATELPRISPQQLETDLTALQSAIANTHPDICFSVDRQALARAIGDVRARLDRPMTRDEAWVEFTALNSVLADGHLSVIYPGGAAAEVRRHLNGGGLLFPYAVHIDQSGAIYVRAMFDGGSTPLAGCRITMLDGRTADEVVAKLLAHTNGDTPALRAALLSDRFPFWYWKFFGERRTHRLTLGIDGVMPYIASAPYSNGSSCVLKVIEGRPREGQKVGDVVRGTQRSVYPPQLDNPLRFEGRLYVLIGPRTYSSSVLFTNVLQDKGFAIVAGVGGAARSTQSGGTQSITLPNTGMSVVVPRFVLTRPSGAAGLLQPDLLVIDDPFRPMSAVQVLLRSPATAPAPLGSCTR